MSQPTLFDAPEVASVRRSDPRSAKRAAAHDPEGRDLQRLRILRFLAANGPATADDCARVTDAGREAIA